MENTKNKTLRFASVALGLIAVYFMVKVNGFNYIPTSFDEIESSFDLLTNAKSFVIYNLIFASVVGCAYVYSGFKLKTKGNEKGYAIGYGVIAVLLASAYFGLSKSLDLTNTAVNIVSDVFSNTNNVSDQLVTFDSALLTFRYALAVQILLGVIAVAGLLRSENKLDYSAIKMNDNHLTQTVRGNMPPLPVITKTENSDINNYAEKK